MFSESVILYIFSWIQDDFLYISTKFSTDFVDRQKSTLYTNNLLMQSIDTYFLMHCHVWPTYAGDSVGANTYATESNLYPKAASRVWISFPARVESDCP